LAPSGSPRIETEREVKLGAGAGFRLPDLNGVLDGVTAVPLPEQDLRAVYYDTPDLRLARWGVSVRYRTGEGEAWTVKLPVGGDGTVLSRRELSWQAPPGAVPPEVVATVRAYARRSPLLPVARLHTTRSGVRLSDSGGQALAEVVVDDVSVRHEGQAGCRFREVELELAASAPRRLMEAVVERLAEAGGGRPDPKPKVVRALGDRALAAPELEPVALGAGASVADAVRAAMVASVTRILSHDAGVRTGDDPEDVHQARVGTRRLRSDLRTFAPVLVGDWVEPLRSELGWLAGQLGAVRDADVLAGRLRRQAGDLPDSDAPGLATLFERLDEERRDARRRLAVAMDGDRYVDLLEALVARAQRPLLADGAERAAAEVLPGLSTRPWRHLAKAVRSLSERPGNDELHGVRIQAKRARYAAEAAAPVVGDRAASLAKAVSHLQTVLGDHQDAVVAEDWLRRAALGSDTASGTASGTASAAALAAGELIGVQRAEEAACRRAWPKAWKKANKKKRRSWLG